MTQPHSYMIAGPAGELAVHDWAPDDSDRLQSPVLLAHPTGFHGLVWAPVADRLVAAGRHAWSFDFRGHGNSDAPDPDGGAYAWDGVLRALAAGAVGRPRPAFAHAAEVKVGPYVLIGCFHPSQQNTFTGRLTPPMIDAVLERARRLARE